MYARKNTCYNELGFRTNYVRSSIGHYTNITLRNNGLCRLYSAVLSLNETTRWLQAVYIDQHALYTATN